MSEGSCTGPALKYLYVFHFIPQLYITHALKERLEILMVRASESYTRRREDTHEPFCITKLGCS